MIGFYEQGTKAFDFDKGHGNSEAAKYILTTKGMLYYGARTSNTCSCKLF